MTGALWSQGDFNYDGTVNALDFGILASNFGQVMSSPAMGTLVPEPMAMLLALPLLGLKVLPITVARVSNPCRAGTPAHNRVSERAIRFAYAIACGYARHGLKTRATESTVFSTTRCSFNLRRCKCAVTSRLTPPKLLPCS